MALAAADSRNVEVETVNARPAATILPRTLLLLCLAAVVAYAAMLDLLPPLEKDALIHHLALPKLWLKQGGIKAYPWAPFSLYPMNLELLYLIPLAFGQDVAAKFIHHGFGLLTAALIFFHLRRRLGFNWACLGALIFLSTPAVWRLATTAYVDLGLIFFMTAALLGLVYWRESGRSLFFVLSALSFGLALGVKYNALIGLPLFFLGISAIKARAGDSASRSFSWAFLFLVLAGVMAAPWWIRNLVLTGNPVYPMFNHLFGLPSYVPAGMDVGVFKIRQVFYGESLPEILLIPVRAFFQGRDFTPQYFDGVLNPALLLLPILSLFRPKFPETKPLAIFAALWILMVFFQASFIVRYVLPAVPVLAILAVFGLHRLWFWLSKKVSWSVASGILILVTAGFLSLNAVWAAGFWKARDPWPFLAGRETRPEYLSRKLDFYPAVEYINRNLPEKARVLLLFAGDRGYYLERDYFYYWYYSGEILRPILDRASSGEDVLTGLKNLGVTHVLARDDLLDRHLRNTWPREKLRPWVEFSKNGWQVLFSARGFSVYELK